MSEFSIKKTIIKKIGEKNYYTFLKTSMNEIFGNCNETQNGFCSAYGVLSKINVNPINIQKISLTTENIKNNSFKDEDILNTKRKLNYFLEKITGFTAKERMKLIKNTK